MNAQISAIEYIFPEKKVTNDDLASEFLDYDFSNFENKVGIKNRYIADENTTALDLAVAACEKIFLKVDRNTIDFILYCSQSPEYFLPTTACMLQQRIGLRRGVGAFDYNLGCSGFVYGIGMAKALIESGLAGNVLVVTSETYSKYLHPKDRSNRSIFGDAAACTLVSASQEKNICNFLFGTDGAGFDKLIIKNGAGKNKFDPNAQEISYGTGNVYSDNHLYMDGPEIMNFTNDVIPDFTNEVMKKNEIEDVEIDQYIYHQANAFMLNGLRKKLKTEKDKFYIDLADGGNTVSCTIPIALKKYSQRIEKGATQKIIIVGFGVGLSWAGGLILLNDKL